MCAIFPQYRKAYTCVVAEFNRCSLGDFPIKSSAVSLMTPELNVLCNDSEINYDCLAQTQQQSAQMLACLESQSSSIDPSTHTAQENNCLNAKIGSQCLVDLVTKCDTHTGNVMGNLSKSQLSIVCGNSVVG
ncbi:hypothetical protein BsWGS_28364 [Bradybaena similaris]